MNKVVENEKLEIEKLEGVLGMVEKLEAAHTSGSLDLNTCKESFQNHNKHCVSQLTVIVNSYVPMI